MLYVPLFRAVPTLDNRHNYRLTAARLSDLNLE